MGAESPSRKIYRIAAVAALIGALLPFALLQGTAYASTKTWTGLGGDNLWSNPGNWSAAIVAGDDLVFPAGVANKQSQNDFAANTSFASITVQDGGYNIFGNPALTPLIHVAAGPVTTASAIQFSPIRIPATGMTVDVDAGADVQMNVQWDYNSAVSTIVYDIDGTLQTNHIFTNVVAGDAATKTGAGTYKTTSGFGGAVNVQWSHQAGNLFFNANNNHGAVVTQTGGVCCGTQGQTQGITVNGGIYSPGSDVFDVATSAIAAGGFTVGAGGTYKYDINGGASADSLFVTGTVTLAGNLTFDATGVVLTAGMSFTVLQNDGADAIVGTFIGKPQGSTVNINGTPFTISYTGGDGNDVTLTASGAIKSWDGGPAAADDFWSTSANWETNVAPVAGDTLRFGNNPPVAVIDQPNQNDYAAGTSFADILFDGASDYNLTGNAIALTGGVVNTSGASSNTVSLDTTFTGGGGVQAPSSGITFAGAVDADGSTISIGQSQNITFSGNITNGAMTIEGTQTNVTIMGGAKSFAGPFTNNSGNLFLNATLTNAQVVNHGNSGMFQGSLFGTGGANGLNIDSGRFFPGSQNTAGTFTSASDVVLNGSSVFQIDVNGPGTVAGTDFDRLNVTGTVTLGGALQVDSSAAPGNAELVIIANDGSDPIVGTFQGVAQGAIVVVSGVPMVASYTGGDGNDFSLSLTNAKIWDGGGGNDNWTTGVNWVGDVAPLAGATLIFPSGAARLTNVNDFPAGTAFQDIIFNAGGYTISGNSINLTGALFGNNTTLINTLTFPMVLSAANKSFDQQTGGETIFGGTITVNAGNTLTLTGGGTQTIQADKLAGGALTVNKTQGLGGGTLNLAGQAGWNGPLNVDKGNVALSGTLVAPTFVTGTGPGTVGSAILGDGSTGSLTLLGSPGGPTFASASPADVTAPFNTQGILTIDGNLSVGTTTQLSTTINGGAPVAGTTFGQFKVNGTVNLAGGFFNAGNSAGTPPVGVEIVVIDNDGVDPVSGTFAGLAEGATTMVGGTFPAKISYVGGTGNDVTLFLAPTFNWDAGAAPTASWSNATNWSPDVAPQGSQVPDETLVFGGLGSGLLTPNNDLAAGKIFNDIQVTFPGYTLSGNAIVLDQGIAATNVSGTTNYNIATTFVGNDGTISQTGGGTFAVNSAMNLGGGTLALSGAGDFTGLDLVSNGSLIVGTAGSGTVNIAGTMPGLAGPIVVNSGTLNLTGNLALAGVTVNGGTLKGTGTPKGINALGGTVSPGASPAQVPVAGNFNLAGPATLNVELNGTTVGTQYDQLDVTGTVTLGGTLAASLGFVPTNGNTFTIINNDGADPVVGTFAGLPNNAALMIGGTPFVVKYNGGDGNDVVLIAGPTVNLNTAATAVVEGNAPANTSAGLTVVLNAVQGANVTVHVQITGGTATEGTDTNTLNTDVTITAGQPSAPVPLTITGDPDLEPDETVDVTLTVVTPGVQLGSPAVATVTITNDDVAATTTSEETTTTAATTTTVAPTTTLPPGGTTTVPSGGGGGGPNVTSDVASPIAGQAITLSAANLCANAAATFTAVGPGGSSQLGTSPTNGFGAVSLGTTAPTQPGSYTITVSSTGGGCSLSASLILNVRTLSGELPATGNDATGVVTLSFFALLAGGTLLALRRRRRPLESN